MLKERRTAGLPAASMEHRCAYRQPSEGTKTQPAKAQKGKTCAGMYTHTVKSHRTRKDLKRSDLPSIHPAEQGSFGSNAFTSPTTHFILGNSPQKDAKLSQRGAAHPLPLPEPRRRRELTAFRTGSADTEKGYTTQEVYTKCNRTTQAMVRFVSSLLLVKKNKSKTLCWMESDLILLPLFVLYSKFCSLLSNSKECLG